MSTVSSPFTLRVIAPSMSWDASRGLRYRRATKRLEQAGYRVTFGDNIFEALEFGTASVKSRLQDLHAAYSDTSVDAILCLNGGWSSNELLDSIDWNLISAHPTKPLIGFSDITVLHNAIFAKTGNIGLLGPNLGSLGDECWQYSIHSMKQLLANVDTGSYGISRGWKSGDRIYKTTRPWKIVQPGMAHGTLIGGNIGSLYLLQGTEYMPRFTGPTVIALEDDDEAGSYTSREFDRRFESLLQQPGLRENLKAVLVGRFENSSGVRQSDIANIISRKLPSEVTVVSDIDIGHTTPMMTLPIGGIISVNALGKAPIITYSKERNLT